MNLPSESLVKAKPPATAPARSLVVYHFFEKDPIYIRNFAHFLLFGYTEQSDFLIVIAGDHTIDLPRRNNVRYLFTENKNNDYGGYCEAMQVFGDEILAYDYVYFVNSSVRGPFLPPICNQHWQDIFKSKLSEDVGLVGTTINILSSRSYHSERFKRKYGGTEPFSHVQTMAYAMTRRTLTFLCEQGFYTASDVLSKEEVIDEYELRLSQLILRNGWNITSLLPEYADLDYREPHRNINPSASSGDPNDPLCYFGRSPHPFEVMFAKANRNIFSEEYLIRLAYSGFCKNRPNLQWENDTIIRDYASTLESVGRSTDLVPFADSRSTTTDQILRWVEVMLRQEPGMRPKIEGVLKRMS
jgi:hypothetical protein